MDKKYVTLFRDLAESTAISAEQVMDYDLEKDDKNGYATAQIMRDNYADLKERLTDDYLMTKADAAKLTVGAIILVNQLEDRINNLKKAMTGYQTELLPVLKEIVEAETDEIAAQIANEKFVIESNE